MEWSEKYDSPIQKIEPGKPQQSAYMERDNRTVMHEWLEPHSIASVEKARHHATQWLWTTATNTPAWDWPHDNRSKAEIGGLSPTNETR